MAPHRYTSLIVDPAPTQAEPVKVPRPVIAVEKRALTAYAQLVGGLA